MFQERYYQTEAADLAIDYIEHFPGKNPVVVMPAGTGKTVVICGIIDRFLTKNPIEKVLVLSHDQDIVEQDWKACIRHFGNASLYAAGLGSKLIGKITVAQIQSCANVAEYFSDFSLVLIDEAHSVDPKQQGRYRKFLEPIKAPICGLTATPFRLGHGYITEGKTAIFHDVVYDLSHYTRYNKLVAEGYLCKLLSKKTETVIELEGVKTSAGDFNKKDLSLAVDRDSITQAAIVETVKYGKVFKKWLLFGIDIQHCEHIKTELEKHGISCGLVHSKMKGDRKAELRKFKEGEYRAMVNCETLTTGLDIPEIDLISILRPTKSPVLHVQIAGRGQRPVYAPGHDLSTTEARLEAIKKGGKRGCLVLDFAGNTRRLGPINDITVKRKGKKGGKPIVKECPDCGCLWSGVVKVCDNCGHEFLFNEKIKTTAGDDDVVMSEPTVEWCKVDSVEYEIYEKPGKPRSLVVYYKVGLKRVKQWVCYDHEGFAKQMAFKWVRNRLPRKEEMPTDVFELYLMQDKLIRPSEILVRFGKFDEVIDWK